MNDEKKVLRRSLKTENDNEKWYLTKVPSTGWHRKPEMSVCRP